MMRDRRLIAGTLLTLMSVAVSGVQTASAAPPKGALEEVVVTATRRETNLQTTPVAVSALDQNFIKSVNPTDLGDLASFVPNFSAGTITNFHAASFAMRGVGQNSIIVYFEPPVAVLVDDFVMSSVQTQLLDTFDVKSVQVLRGPQGTLFGKNTTGGAVVVDTKRPRLDNWEAQLQAEAGSWGTRKYHGSLDVPLIKDTLGFRLVGVYNKSDGYMKDGACYGPVVTFVPSKFAGLSGCGPGNRVGGDHIGSARAKLLWEPTDGSSILFQYSYLRDNSRSPVGVNTTPADPSFLTYNLNVGGQRGDPLTHGGLTNRTDNLLDMKHGYKINVDGYYLNAKFDVGAGTITNVAGYRSQRSRLPNSYVDVVPVAADGEPLSLFDANRSDNRKTWQEELRFASSFSGPFNFVSGVFYQHEEIEFCVAQTLGFLDLVGPGTPWGPWNQNPYILCNAQKATSEAAYAQGTYDLTEKWQLTFGGRYSWEQKRWQGRQQVFAQQINPSWTWRNLSILKLADFNRYPDGAITDKHAWADPTYRLGLSYQWTPDVFAYGSYSHGFKSGDYNDQIGSFAAYGSNLAAFQAAAQPTNPERADSYELGLKTQSFDNRLRLNVTGFYVEYSDMQKQIVVPINVGGNQFQVTRYFNAAKATVYGGEFEATALITDQFTLRAVLGYQHGQYDNYVTPIPAGYDLSKAPLDRTPKWQWSVSGNYELPVGQLGSLTFNADVNHSSKNLFTQSIDAQNQNSYVDPHTLVNASITWRDPADKYFVRVIGKNLTDQRYKTGSQVVGGLWVNANYGPPRYFGLQAGVKFGGGS